jgi:hypothetical protein
MSTISPPEKHPFLKVPSFHPRLNFGDISSRDDKENASSPRHSEVARSWTRHQIHELYGVQEIFLRISSANKELVMSTAAEFIHTTASDKVTDFVASLLSWGFEFTNIIDVGGVEWTRWTRKSTDILEYVQEEFDAVRLISVGENSVRVVVPYYRLVLPPTNTESVLAKGFTRSAKVDNPILPYWNVMKSTY